MLKGNDLLSNLQTKYKLIKMKKLLLLTITILLAVSFGFSQISIGDTVRVYDTTQRYNGRVGIVVLHDGYSKLRYPYKVKLLDPITSRWYKESELEKDLSLTPLKRKAKLSKLILEKEEKDKRLEVLAQKRWEDRIKSRKSRLIASYGISTTNKILRREIWLGMTPTMARESIGSPKDINRTVTAYGAREQWVYSNRYLYFRDGILTAWQD